MSVTLEVRDARFIDPEETFIDCEVNHPVHGWIPYTAVANDVEPFGRAVHAAAVAGTVSPYTAPPDPTPEEQRAAMPTLTARQLRLGLIANGITLASVQSAIDGITDPTEREVAQVEWEYATTFERTHSLISQIGSALNLTPEEIDTMWSASISL